MENKSFLGNVLAGLAGGLLFYGAQIGSDEFIRILSLPSNFWTKLFIPLPFAFLMFIIFALTIKSYRKKS